MKNSKYKVMPIVFTVPHPNGGPIEVIALSAYQDLEKKLGIARAALSRCVYELDEITNGPAKSGIRRDMAIEAHDLGLNVLSKLDE